MLPSCDEYRAIFDAGKIQRTAPQRCQSNLNLFGIFSDFSAYIYPLPRSSKVQRHCCCFKLPDVARLIPQAHANKNIPSTSVKQVRHNRSAQPGTYSRGGCVGISMHGRWTHNRRAVKSRRSNQGSEKNISNESLIRRAALL